MKTTTGTCTSCGKENCQLTIIDDVDRVCDECLETDYDLCDICGEYWDLWHVDFFYLDDGRHVCANCKDELDEGIAE